MKHTFTLLFLLIAQIHYAQEDLKTYQCDYNAQNIHTILQSGSKYNAEFVEYWGINPKDVEGFEKVDPDDVDFDQLAQYGKQHLLKKFPDAEPQMINMSMHYVFGESRDIMRGYALFHFKCKNQRDEQVVPILMDGTIILNNQE